MTASAGSQPVSVVLVHGGFVDGSGWEGVYGALRADGYNVAIVQNPTLSLAGDVDATNRVAIAWLVPDPRIERQHIAEHRGDQP